MDMRLKLLATLLLVLVTACARYSLDFVARYDPGQDYTKYKTFNFYEGTGRGAVATSQELDERLRTAVEATLVDYGYTKADKPDFYVTYWVSVTGAENLDPMHHDGNEIVGNEKFQSGALVLDFVDATTSSRYWRGAVMGDIAERTPKDRLEKAVEAILDNYPPKD
jgi:hypothetical protein